MARKPAWRREEFEVVLCEGDLPIEELQRRLPGRSKGAIEVVLAGLHAYHQGRQADWLLSRMMIEEVQRRQGTVRCPRCGVEL